MSWCREDLGSRHCWQPELPLPLGDPVPPAIQRLGPLCVGAGAGGGWPGEPPTAQLRSVVEAVLRVHYHKAPPSAEGDVPDPRSVEGMRRALSQEPSLAWAEPHATTCVKLLKERSHSTGALTPLGKESKLRQARKVADRCAGKPGRLPPVGAGGAGCMAAYFMKSQSASSLSGAAAARLAGVEPELSAALSWRLRQLTISKPGARAWLIVETCRDCAKHPVFNHDESAFILRFEQLKAAVERNFPAEVQVALLVPAAADANAAAEAATPRAAVPPLRPGAFEVFLCCPEPFASFGAVELPTWGMPGEVPQEAAGGAFTAICVASRLQAKTWPSVEAVIRRLVTVMPRIPLRIDVRNSSGLPLPGVLVEVATTQVFRRKDPARQQDVEMTDNAGGQIRLTARSDKSGFLRFSVPICVPMRIEASHDVLMPERPQREVLYTTTAADEEFVSDTVVQLWQYEAGEELVVLCTAPRVTPEPELLERPAPFQGAVELPGRRELAPDERGCLRGPKSLLEDIEAVLCPGWRTSRPPPGPRHVEAPGVVLELARLAYPIVKVALVAACCSTRLPRAEIAVDGRDRGATSEDGEPVACGLRLGEHCIEARHHLAPESLRIPFAVRGSATCGVQVKVSPKRLRFVCIAEPPHLGSSSSASGSGAGRRRLADLWLVGGRAEAARLGRRQPPGAGETWLWEGDLCGAGEALPIVGGVLVGSCPPSSSGCGFSDALAKLSGRRGQWRVMLNRLFQGGCALRRLAEAAEDGASEAWLAKLAFSAGDEEEAEGPVPYQLRLRGGCCRHSFSGPSVTVCGGGPTAVAQGRCTLPPQLAGTKVPAEISGLPAVLLPGGTSSFMVNYGLTTEVEVEVHCKVWVYWVPPQDDGIEAVEAGLVCIAVDPEQLPEEARPVKGTAHCPNAEVQDFALDGTSFGPFELRAPSDSRLKRCLLAGLTFQLEAPDNFVFMPKDTSPLAERCAEVGGCELQRLVACPVAIGTMCPLPPPAPHVLRLRSACCKKGFCQAEVRVNGAPASAVAETPGKFELPRRRVYEKYEGTLDMAIDDVPGCLLPNGQAFTLPYGPEEQSVVELEVRCALWAFWVPPPEHAEPPEGFVWLTADEGSIPKGARTLRGKLECPRSQQKSVRLNGSTFGPFVLTPCEKQALLPEAPCLLAELQLRLEPPADFEFLPERTDAGCLPVLSAEGCGLQHLVQQQPVAVGLFRALPPPPLQLRFRTSCCRRGFAGSTVAIDDQAPQALAEDGCLALTRQRRGGAFRCAFAGLPPCLLPYEPGPQLFQYGPKEPAALDVDILSLLWVYWTPPEPEEDHPEESLHDDPLTPEGLLFVAVDKEQVPDDAKPVCGILACAGALNPRLELVGDTTGPFKVRPGRRALPALKRRQEPASDEEDEGDDSEADASPSLEARKSVSFVKDAEAAGPADSCLFGELKFQMSPPPGYEYHARIPSPLEERLAELGGCELQRVASCPVAVGSFKEVPHPMPLRVIMRTSCCGRGWADAQVEVDGCPAKRLLEEGCFRVPARERHLRAGTGQLLVKYGGAPAELLPSQQEECEVNYGPHEPKNHLAEVSSMVWIYYVPPEDEESEEELEEGEEPAPPPTGMVFIAVCKDQIPKEAEPVDGVLRCPGAESESITLNGATMGPFYLRRPLLDDGDETDRPEEPECLLSKVFLELDAPMGMEWCPRDPSPLLDRVCELGGCELQRLVSCPQVMGYYRPLPRPPLQLSLRTSCCGRPLCGAAVAINKKASRPLDEDGHLEVRRKINGGSLRMLFDNVPPFLLPRGQAEVVEGYGAFEPASIDVATSCSVWIYCIPGEEEEPGEDEGEELPPPDGTIWVALDAEQVPEEAQAVTGVLLCPGAASGRLDLDGSSMGPFDLRPAEPPPACGAGDEGPRCLLAGLALELEPPEDYVFRARDPSPLLERCEELGGCELQRLTSCPVVIGFFSPTPRPPLHLCLRTGCCGRAWAGTRVALNGREAVPLEDEAGRMEVSRRRAGGDLLVHVEGPPESLLPCGSAHQVLSYSPFEPLELPLEIECHLWVYWVPPPDEPGEAGEDEEADAAAAEGTVWIAMRQDQVPEGAQPLSGTIAIRSNFNRFMVMDGTSMGPFPLEREATDPAALDDGDRLCALANLAFGMAPIEGFEYRARQPSPLLERCQELGGCELQRLMASPVAVGAFRPLPVPPLQLAVRTACCGSCFAGGLVSVDGRRAAAPDERGILPVHRRRTGGQLALKFEGVPPSLLPGGSEACALDYGAEGPAQLDVEVACPLWIYWVPPDEEEEEPEEGEEPLPIEATVWVACKQEDIPDEARPIAGQVLCPGAEDPALALDGTSMGPFFIRLARGHPEEPPCLLSALDFASLAAPAGFGYRPRDPSPLLERCEELGGCEMQRLLSSCPSVVGYLKKL